MLFLLIIFISNIYLPINAAVNDYKYSYTYNGITYYSNESEDDAWYQAMLDNYEKGLIVEEEIQEEYAIFSRKNLNEISQIYDNQEDKTGEPNTYVNGYLTWETSTNYILPLKNVKVELYDKQPFNIKNRLLATTYTNVDGYYNFKFENNENLNELGGYDIFIRIYPSSSTFQIARDWLFASLSEYYLQTNTVSNVKTGTTTDFNVTVKYNENINLNCAFYLSQGFVTAQRFAIEMGMKTDRVLKVIFPFGEEEYGFSYRGYSGIAKEYFNSFDTAMHEYGHFVECIYDNYGSNLFEIILYNPNHYSSTDHFDDKENKNFAMELTWSEAWATAFSQIAQEKYLSEYEGKVIKYGDLKCNDIYVSGSNYEDYKTTSSSCEAQEDAVIASLWDLFDNGSNEYFDNISLSYKEWWDMTTKSKTQTLSNFFEVVNTYYPEYLGQIGEVFGTYQISPANFKITNLESISETVVPKFSWTVNGSKNNPNNSFQLVFYNLYNVKLYETEVFESNLNYNNNYEYNFMPLEEWKKILSYFEDKVDMKIVVRGYNSKKPKSGPYNSNYEYINIEIDHNHKCSYVYNYLPYFKNAGLHMSYCSCGNYILSPHQVSTTAVGRYRPCIFCGALVDTSSFPVIVNPITSNNILTSKNVENLSTNLPTYVEDNEEDYLKEMLKLYYKKEYLY